MTLYKRNKKTRYNTALKYKERVTKEKQCDLHLTLTGRPIFNHENLVIKNASQKYFVQKQKKEQNKYTWHYWANLNQLKIDFQGSRGKPEFVIKF